MCKFVQNTTGAYHNVAQVRDVYVDNNNPSDWYVAVRMADGNTFAILDGFTTGPDAEAAAKEVVDALGYIDLVPLI